MARETKFKVLDFTAVPRGGLLLVKLPCAESDPEWYGQTRAIDQAAMDAGCVVVFMDKNERIESRLADVTELAKLGLAKIPEKRADYLPPLPVSATA